MAVSGIFDFDEKAAARIVGVTTRTMRSWRKAKKVSFYRTPGGRIRYTVDQLTDLQRRCRIKADERDADEREPD